MEPLRPAKPSSAPCWMRGAQCTASPCSLPLHCWKPLAVWAWCLGHTPAPECAGEHETSGHQAIETRPSLCDIAKGAAHQVVVCCTAVVAKFMPHRMPMGALLHASMHFIVFGERGGHREVIAGLEADTACLGQNAWCLSFYMESLLQTHVHITSALGGSQMSSSAL